MRCRRANATSRRNSTRLLVVAISSRSFDRVDDMLRPSSCSELPCDGSACAPGHADAPRGATTRIASRGYGGSRATIATDRTDRHGRSRETGATGAGVHCDRRALDVPDARERRASPCGGTVWSVGGDECLLDDARRHPADQVVPRAGLVVGAAGPRAAEGLLPDHGTGRLVVDVEVAGGEAQRLGGPVDDAPVGGEDRRRSDAYGRRALGLRAPSSSNPASSNTYTPRIGPKYSVVNTSCVGSVHSTTVGRTK